MKPEKPTICGTMILYYTEDVYATIPELIRPKFNRDN